MYLSTPGHDLSSKERTIDVISKENVGFRDLLLSPKVLSGLQKSRFERPSPIQLKAIPYGRCGLDLIVQAKSGTGKTCVFTVVALEAVSVDTSCLQVIVLAPTREIAVQIHDVITAVGQDLKGLKVSAFIGGRPIADDRLNAKGCHIAVGSPGRIFQLIQMDVLKCQNVRIFVLDEADKLLEENFQSQINSIYSMLPANKQMIAASATYPEELAQFVTRYMRDPTYVRLNPTDMALLGVKQYYFLADTTSEKIYSKFECKIRVVIDLLSVYPFQQALIFSNYHSHAKDLSEACNSSGLPATYISGNMEQERRLEAMKMLKEFQCRVLISTDLTARGIDASNVDLVINLDVPSDWETYMHRTGRAGRFGSRGSVISVVMSGKEMESLMNIAMTCSVTILPVSLKGGHVEFGKNSISLEGKTSFVPEKKTSSLKPLDSNVSIQKKEEKHIDNENTKTVSHSVSTNTVIPKIPSLPELMSNGNTENDSTRFSFAFSDLMENFLHYKEHGTFMELKTIKETESAKEYAKLETANSENQEVTTNNAEKREEKQILKHVDLNIVQNSSDFPSKTDVPNKNVTENKFKESVTAGQSQQKEIEQSKRSESENLHVSNRKATFPRNKYTSNSLKPDLQPRKKNSEKTKKKKENKMQMSGSESYEPLMSQSFLLPHYSAFDHQNLPDYSKLFFNHNAHHEWLWARYYAWQQYWSNIQMMYWYGQ